MKPLNLLLLSGLLLSQPLSAQLATVFESDIIEISQGPPYPTKDYWNNYKVYSDNYIIDVKVAPGKPNMIRTLDKHTFSVIAERELPNLENAAVISIAVFDDKFQMLLSEKDPETGALVVLAREIDPKTATVADEEKILIDLAVEMKTKRIDPRFFTFSIGKFWDNVYKTISSEDKSKLLIYYRISSKEEMKEGKTSGLVVHVFDSNLDQLSSAYESFETQSYSKRQLLSDFVLNDKGEFSGIIRTPVNQEAPKFDKQFEDRSAVLMTLKPGESNFSYRPIIPAERSAVKNIQMALHPESQEPLIAGFYRDSLAGEELKLFTMLVSTTGEKTHVSKIASESLPSDIHETLESTYNPEDKKSKLKPEGLQLAKILFDENHHPILVIEKYWVYGTEIIDYRTKNYIVYTYDIEDIIVIKIDGDKIVWTNFFNPKRSQIDTNDDYYLQLTKTELNLFCHFETKRFKTTEYYDKNVKTIPKKPYYITAAVRFDINDGTMTVGNAFTGEKLEDVTKSAFFMHSFERLSEREFFSFADLGKGQESWFKFTIK